MAMEYTGKPPLKKRKWNRELLGERICIYILFFGMGALLESAELLFGVRPFGIALAAAAGAPFPVIAAGSVLFCIFAGEYATIPAMGILALGRLGLSLIPDVQSKDSPLFGERVSTRITLSSAAVLFAGTLRLFQGDFRYYYLFGLLLGTIAAAIATWGLCGLFFPRDRLFPYSYEAGLGGLLLLCVFATRTVSFAGIYPAAVCAALIAFWLASHYGVLISGIAGLLLGGCFMLSAAPAFLLCGAGLAFLKKNSRGGGALAGCALASAYIFAVLGSEGLLSLLPSLLTAGAFFLAIDSTDPLNSSPIRKESILRRRNACRIAKQMQQEFQAQSMNAISGTLSELSGILCELGGKQRRPGQLELRHLCDREFDKTCPTCRAREHCWGSEYQSTVQTVAELSACLYQSGHVTKERIPQAMSARCTALPNILERINTGARQLFEEALRGDKTSVVATDYAVVSKMLTDTLAQSQNAYEIHEDLGERIAARLQKMGYTLESVSVCGTEHFRIRVCDLKLPGRRVKLRELRGVLERLCKVELGEAQLNSRDGQTDYLFEERLKYTCTNVKHSRAKNGRESGYCGDSVTAFSNTCGHSFSLLCDGMGSGNGAALTSALCATVLTRFLQAGMRADTSLQMLNGLLAARARRENEASCTIDLLEIDCVNGKATLYKCGAGPTYLLRAGQLTRFFSHTAPIGILESLDAERLSFEVQSGDVLVQVSDGITGGEEDCPWLAEMLLSKWDGDAEEFSRMVINHASRIVADDLSVMITRVGDAPIPWMQAAG